MNLNIFFMNGYGLYVWSAFVFTFLVCLILYFKTRKSLRKLERDFKEEVEKLRGTFRVKVGEVKVDCPLDKEECRDILNSINQERIREKIKE